MGYLGKKIILSTPSNCSKIVEMAVPEKIIQEAGTMGYTKTDFGTMKDGRAVYRYTLTNGNGVSASFTDFGAIWLTMVVPDKDGNMADVVLGYDTVETIQGGTGHLGEMVGR